MTGLGIGGAATGVALLALGVAAGWPPMVVLGSGMVVAVVGAVAHVFHRPRLALSREVEPPRVEKGSAAIAVVRATNLSRRALPPVTLEQRLGGATLRARLPRLRRGESGLRTYRLPTGRRGLYEVSPMELPRSDPFGLCRTVQTLGEPQLIAVHPRLIALSGLPSAASRNLEGTSSDLSPQGSVSFHRLREYVPGDDLRAVHWPSTARAGRLVVRHHVDTAEPYSVVLLDLDPAAYSEETFEAAVDVAASLVASLARGRAPVELRTSAGTRVGGAGEREVTAAVDHLTTVAPSGEGSLRTEALRLAHGRGGTAVVAVTGRIERGLLPAISGLRRRFERVMVASVAAAGPEVAAPAGVGVIWATDADALALAWDAKVAAR